MLVMDQLNRAGQEGLLKSPAGALSPFWDRIFTLLSVWVVLGTCICHLHYLNCHTSSESRSDHPHPTEEKTEVQRGSAPNSKTPGLPLDLPLLL
jgi:hypothetical protein